MSQKISLGKKGEDLAAEFLQKKGYKVLERNFKKGYGEIDIIALNEDTLVFLEVKTRQSSEFGKPEEAVNVWKLRHVARTANFYKMLHPELPELLRIDVVAIEIDEMDGVKSIKLIKNVYTEGLS